MPLKFWVLSVICPMLPDADAVAFRLGIPYSSALGHRGFFHSLLFSLIIGIVITGIFFREKEFLSREWLLLCGYFSLVSATHGILDAPTNGGPGTVFFSPLTNKRYFFPWTPIEVAPIGIKAFFSAWGMRVLRSEIVWIWIPSALIAVLSRILHHGKT
jgi:inner membrane protein